uniref:Anaphylatoxin-like domain-containing protein n=1 Tax=Salarias fasciatus TaxID=181472 RepID=A0A672GY97_SALFA
MSAPNLLRVETTENIFVECQDCTGGDIRVQINVMNHPTKIEVLDSTSVTLTRQNNYQMFGQISAATFSKDPRVKQHVYLQAQFDDQLLEKVVLVSFQSGHIFIQTDKTLYTPDSRVVYRMFAVTPQMEPVERDPRTRFENTIDIEIVVMCLVFSKHKHAAENMKSIPGLWKVVARFYNNQQQRFSADFEVKEYVLPSFEVKLKPQVPVFYVDSSDLTVEIRATYLLGEAVDGTGYVVFGLMQDGQKKGFPASIQRLPVQLGEGRAVLKREHITQTFPNIQELVGDSIFVSVSVLTENGTEMVEAEVGGIQIVTSPYTIHFKKTPRYFKPGMPFDLTVEVLNPDESPAGNVPVLVFPGEVQGVTASNGIARLFVNTEGNSQSLDIQARTNDPGLTPTRQAEAKMTAHSYASSSARFIHIGVDLVDIQIGNNLIVHLSLNSLPNREQDITYLIVSRGQLVKFKRFKTQGQVLIARNIPITKEILPSFRVVAYYHTDDEVVSDSVWVDAKDSCMGSVRCAYFLQQSLYDVKERKYQFIFISHLFAPLLFVFSSQVWDKVENHDTGCTPGGGKDSMGVFYDAGLLFVTNTGSETPHRLEILTGTNCSFAVDKYKSSEQQKDCCVDGMRETSPSYSCERRSEYIVDGPACVEAFLDCCREMTTQRADHQEDSLKLAHREEDDDSYVDNIDIFTRSSFPESWLWTDVDLPACPAGGPKLTSVEKSFPLPDSFTTWQFTGISLSRTHGICVGEPLEVIVQKEFFIDLRLPYSAVRGELLEIKAILHNYSPDAITVRVDLMETQHVCSAAFKHGPYRQEVNVGPQTTLSVPFIIVPMREGEVQIEVKAAVKDSSLSDGIMKWLRVVVRDTDTSSFSSPQSPPQNSGHLFFQKVIFETLVESVVSGKQMGALIYQPSGPGEPNMIHMTYPVSATIYLDRTNQWEAVGFHKRDEALKYIKTGYYRELTYRKKDGSFVSWANRPSSSWLTAYVAKVFTMAHSLVAVQEEVICDAIKYLILNTQQPDGMFREVGTVLHAEMTGDVKGSDTEASMTAFKLIAMQESRPLCAATVNSLSGSIDKAVSYLERRLDSLTNPYAVAMTSYALANEGKLNREVLYSFVSPGVFTGHQYTLEATAYALLALVKTRVSTTKLPLLFVLSGLSLFTHRLRLTFSSSLFSLQATLMVYQALSEYWINAEKPEYHLNVDIFMPGKPKPYKFNVNRENHHLTRTLKMVSVYYALPQEKQSDCQRFNMSVELIPGNLLLSIKTAEMCVCTQLSQGRAYTIAKYEMNTVLSERGSLIIYLDKVSHIRPEEISFRVRQTLKVGVLQPAAVSVYEYYNAETKCVKLYHPDRRAGQPLWFCRGGECTCVAKGSCSLQKKGKISNDERSAKICEATLTNKTEKALRVSKMELKEVVCAVIMAGNTDVGPMGKLRSFLSHQHCRGAVGLQKGKTYLIMGSSQDIRRDDQEQTFWYMLDEKTWVEYWPTTEECQTDEHRPSCSGLEHMVDHPCKLHNLAGRPSLRFWRSNLTLCQLPKNSWCFCNSLPLFKNICLYPHLIFFFSIFFHCFVNLD